MPRRLTHPPETGYNAEEAAKTPYLRDTMKLGARNNRMNHGKSNGRREPVAIVGIGCRFPGNASDPHSFWRLLCDGVDAVTEIPTDRWNIAAYYDPTPGLPGKTYSRWGGFVRGIDAFEPECFGISPREAGHMDPQQRMLLEVSREAIEDAALDSEQLSQCKTGVFIGISTYDYAQMHYGPTEWSGVDPHSATGGASSIAANRISYCLNLRGPSIAVDTACSSSLVAIDLACRSLWQNECDVALAGGVNAIISPGPYIAFCAASMLSRDGRCKTFDASADGFVRGEGAGIIVLKRLGRALEDGDPIYALIGGTAVNHDGRTSGIALPSQTSQEDLVREACGSAGVLPREVDYVEAHGTGTEVGDPIEARALGMVLGGLSGRRVPLVVGSAKTNVGHLEAGAGIVGVIKTALSLKHRIVPPNLHFKNPNPEIPFDDLRLRVPLELEPWPQDDRRAVAGVNSFGFGGTNAHVIMLEHRPEAPGESPSDETGPWLMTLSARTPEALRIMAERCRDVLGEAAGSEAPALPNACYTTQVGRGHHEHRLALTIQNRRALETGVAAYLQNEQRSWIATGRRGSSGVSQLAFVFAGQGPQWWGMGRQLLSREPVFRETIHTIDELMERHVCWSLVHELTLPEADSRIQRTEIAQPALFALEVALATLWDSWGVRPDVVVGHSVGEIAAAHIAGALSLEDAVKVIVHRGRCMERASSKGRMLAVALPQSEAERAIAGYETTVALAAVNGPASVTLSGESEPLEAIRRHLFEKGVFCRFLQVDYAFHSPQMDPVRQPLLDALDGLEPREASIRMMSTVTGRKIQGHELTSEYWWRNVRHTVCFADPIGQLIDEGYETFIEVGPHPVLALPLSECLRQRSRSGLLLPSLRREEDEKQVLLTSLGSLYTRGHPIDWEALRPAGARRVRLPTTPWNRQSYWQESEGSKQDRLGPPKHPLLGGRLGTADPTWNNRIDLRALPFLKDHQVQSHMVLPATAYVEMALAAASELFHDGGCAVEELRFHKALFVPENAKPVVQLTFSETDGSFEIRSRMGDESWTLHATGSIKAGTKTPPDGYKDIEGLRRTLPMEFAASDLYAIVAEFDLGYGPSFKGLEQLWRRDGEALGRVSLPSHLTVENSRYRVHPALLDACYQVLVAAFPLKEGKKNRNLFLPVYFQRIDFHASPGPSVWSHMELTSVTSQAVEGHFRVYDDRGRLLLEIQGFRCQAVEEVRIEEAMERWFYEVRWYHRPGIFQSGNRQAVDYIGDTARLLRRLTAATGENGKGDADSWLDRLAAAYINRAARTRGQAPRKAATLEQRVESGRHFLSERCLEILHETVRSKKKIAHVDDPDSLWPAILARHPAYVSELMVLGQLGSRLGDLLDGQLDAAGIVTGGAIDHLLQDSPSFRPMNERFGQLIEQWVNVLPESRSLRILELNARLGGLSAHIVPKLPGNRTQYIVADRNPQLLESARQKLRAYPFVRFETFDIFEDSATELTPPGFDLIVVAEGREIFANGHATLARLRKLLVPGGLVALQVWDNPPYWHELVTRMLAPERATRTRERLLPAAQMRVRKRLLEQAGYAESCGRSFAQQSMLLARNAPLQLPAGLDTQNGATEGAVEHGTWIVFADRGGVAGSVIEMLEARGQRCTRVLPGKAFQAGVRSCFTIRPGNTDDMDRLVSAMENTACRGAIHLWTLDFPRADTLTATGLRNSETLGCHTLMHLVQSVDRINGSTRFTLAIVTAGAQPLGDEDSALAVAAAPVVGIGRVISNEHPGIRCKLIDLSIETRPVEIAAAVSDILNETDEAEIALRHSDRFVPRLERAESEQTTLVPGARTRRPAGAFRLALKAPGVIENLRLQQCARRAPGPDEVEIEVHAASLNFRDVMKTLGLYPSDAGDSLLLGDECSGRIVRVGNHVTGLDVGDEVMTIAPASLGSHVTALASVTMPKPEGMSFAEAATLPVAFATAHYALDHLARLHAGDKVLIHAGAGGVGLAAIQIAQRLGAEIFATAGSPEKRGFLAQVGVSHVMDSRSLTFADEVMEATGGIGVDVVLNSLAGQAIGKGIACLAPHGRFLEIGKRDIYENSKIGLSAFRKNLSFHAIDLGRLMADRPEVVTTLMAALCEQFRTGGLRPLPHRIFAWWQVADAFRYMAQARQIGKVVIRSEETQVTVAAAPRKPLVLEPRATYLVTGGLGGMGLTLARWLAARGAGNIVLIGRRGSDTPGAREAIAELESGSARVLVEKADVSDRKQLKRVLDKIARELPPLRGVLHTAMVLDDGILLQLNRERFQRVMAPKVQGAWNLHQETLGCTLDFFALFSSVSSLVGNQGQANYVAANTFLDTLTHYRRALGLPALTLNWGHLAGVGYVAEREDLGASLTRRGILGISPEEAMEALDTLIQRKAGQMGVMRVDWNMLGRSLPKLARPQRLSSLIHDDTVQENNDDQGTREVIVAARGTERRKLLLGYVTRQAARVMGTSPGRLDIEAPLRDLGLDSLMAVEMRNQIESDLRLSLPTAKLMQTTVSVVKLVDVVLALVGDSIPGAPEKTPAEQTLLAAAGRSQSSCVIALRPGREQPPLFCIHPAEGDVRIYESFAERLPIDRAVYGIQRLHNNGADTANGRVHTIAELAAEYAGAIKAEQPSGCYALMGFSLGGLIATKIANILEREGKRVDFLGLVDCDFSWSDPGHSQEIILGNFVAELYTRLSRELGTLKPMPLDKLNEETHRLARRLLAVSQDHYRDIILEWLGRGYLVRKLPPGYLEGYVAMLTTNLALIHGFRPERLRAPISMWWAGKSTVVSRTDEWQRYTSGAVFEATLDATHTTVMEPPHIDVIAAHVANAYQKPL